MLVKTCFNAKIFNQQRKPDLFELYFTDKKGIFAAE